MDRRPIPDLFRLHVTFSDDHFRRVDVTVMRSPYSTRFGSAVRFSLGGLDELEALLAHLLIDGTYRLWSGPMGEPLLLLEPRSPDQILSFVRSAYQRREAVIDQLFDSGHVTEEEEKELRVPRWLTFYSASQSSVEGHEALETWLAARRAPDSTPEA